MLQGDGQTELKGRLWSLFVEFAYDASYWSETAG